MSTGCVEVNVAQLIRWIFNEPSAALHIACREIVELRSCQHCIDCIATFGSTSDCLLGRSFVLHGLSALCNNLLTGVSN
jgi:hypothetical protein